MRTSTTRQGTYVDGEERYTVSFDRKRELARNWLAQDLPWLKRTAVARMSQIHAYYGVDRPPFN
jgi:hypothetical protein